MWCMSMPKGFRAGLGQGERQGWQRRRQWSYSPQNGRKCGRAPPFLGWKEFGLLQKPLSEVMVLWDIWHMRQMGGQQESEVIEV